MVRQTARAQNSVDMVGFGKDVAYMSANFSVSLEQIINTFKLVVLFTLTIPSAIQIGIGIASSRDRDRQ